MELTEALPVAKEIFFYDKQRAEKLPKDDIMQEYYWGEACSSSMALDQLRSKLKVLAQALIIFLLTALTILISLQKLTHITNT